MIQKITGLRNEIIMVVTMICITVIAVASPEVDATMVIVTLASVGGVGMAGRAGTSMARAMATRELPPMGR